MAGGRAALAFTVVDAVGTVFLRFRSSTISSPTLARVLWKGKCLNFWYSQSSKRAYFYRFAVSTCRNRPLFFVHACSASLINFVFLFLVPKTSPASTILSFLVFSIDFHSFIFYRVVVFFVGFRSAEHLFGVSIGRDQFWFRPCPFFLIRLFHCFDFSCILPDFSLCNRFSKVIPSI